MSERTKFLLFPFILAFATAIFLAIYDGSSPPGAGRRILSHVADILRGAFGTWGTIFAAFVIGLCLNMLASLFNGEEEALAAVEDLPPKAVATTASPPVNVMASTPAGGGFGRRGTQSAPPARPVHVPRTGADLAIETLAVRDFDWYFAHHGYEGNWKQVHRELQDRGQRALAEILQRAGQNYDRYIDEVFTPSDGEPSPQDESRYMAASRALTLEWRAAAGNLR